MYAQHDSAGDGDFVVLRPANVFALVFDADARQDQHAVVVGDDGSLGDLGVEPGPVVVGHGISEGDALQPDVLAGHGCFGKRLGEVLGKPELLVVGMRRDVQLKEGAVAAVVGDGAVDVARVVALVDLVQGREVQVAVVRDHDAPVFLDQVGEVVAGPVVVDFRKVLGRVAGDGLAPVLAAHFFASRQDEFADEPEGDGHRPGPDGAKSVAGLAEVLAPVGDLVGVVDDEHAAADGDPGVLEGIHFLLDQRVVVVDLLEPGVLGRRPSGRDAPDGDVVDDFAPGLVEHGVVGLPDEEGAHRVVARVADGFAVFRRPFVRHEVRHLVDGHLADVQVFFVAEHGLEAPPALARRVAVDQEVLLVVVGRRLAPLVGFEEVLLQVEHLRVVPQIDPAVLVFLSRGNVPPPVLRIDQVQVVRDEAVLLQRADAGQVGVVLVLVPVGLADEPGVVPALDGRPGELVAVVFEPDPVPRALDFFGVDPRAQLEAGGVDGVDVVQRVAELVHVGPVSPRGRQVEGIGRRRAGSLIVLEVVDGVLALIERLIPRKRVRLAPPERIFRRLLRRKPHVLIRWESQHRISSRIVRKRIRVEICWSESVVVVPIVVVPIVVRLEPIVGILPEPAPVHIVPIKTVFNVKVARIVVILRFCGRAQQQQDQV